LRAFDRKQQWVKTRSRGGPVVRAGGGVMTKGGVPRRDWAAIRGRFEELKALLPALAECPAVGPDTVVEVLQRLTIEVEALRRRSIRDRIQLSGLQELVESLLQGGDPDQDLLTLIRYLGRVLGLREALLLRHAGPEGWLAYHAGPGGAAARKLGLLDRVGSTSREAPTNLERYPVVIPLGRGAMRVGAEDLNGQDLLGLLCLAPEAGQMDDDWNPRDIAQRVEGMLETLHHREAMEGAARFRRQLLQAMGDGLLALDPDGAILELNDAAARMLGLSPAEVAGHAIEVLASVHPEPVRFLREALNGRSAPPAREFALGPAGHPLPVNLTARALRSEHGGFGGFVVNLTDLSAVRALEEENRRLDRLATLGRFAAWVAHEIRNPLAGIGAGVEYLGHRMAPDESGREDLSFVTTEVRRLNRIVSDLLDYTRPRPLERQRLEAGMVAERIRMSIQPLLETQGVSLRCDGQEKLLLQADPDRLHQLLLNLTRNAVEASPPGSEVVLHWNLSNSQGQSGSPIRAWVHFRVTDRGSGMTAEDRARAAEPFFSTKKSGTGLGLYIAHTIAEQHGGRLLLESIPGQGTTACLELPVEIDERWVEDAFVAADRG
jgi:PAS domain S-box-containing protein